MSDQNLENGADGGVSEPSSSASISLPSFVDGQLGKERAESLRKDIESDPELAKELADLKGLPEVFDKWRAQRSSLKGTVRVPKEGDGKEVWDQWYKVTGRPESANDYAFEKPKLPEGMTYSAETEKWFREEAHALGLSTQAAKKLFDDYNSLQVKNYSSQSEAAKHLEAKKTADETAARSRELDEAQTAMQRKWGDRYQEKLTKVVSTLQNPSHVPPTLFEKFDKAGILRTPDFLDFIDRYSGFVSEDRKIGITGEEGAVEESEQKPGHLPKGFFKGTAKRYSRA